MATATNRLETISELSGTLEQILERAEQGDLSTLPVLQKMLHDPDIVEILGNLAHQAELSFINALARNNLAFKEGLTRKLELLRAELAGPNQTLIERLLAGRAVACWLQVQDADIRYAQAKDLTWKAGEYYQRRMDHSHKRYLSALKTLAQVRKLAVPVLQINIAKKQTNIAGPAAGKDGEAA